MVREIRGFREAYVSSKSFLRSLETFDKFVVEVGATVMVNVQTHFSY